MRRAVLALAGLASLVAVVAYLVTPGDGNAGASTRSPMRTGWASRTIQPHPSAPVAASPAPPVSPPAAPQTGTRRTDPLDLWRAGKGPFPQYRVDDWDLTDEELVRAFPEVTNGAFRHCLLGRLCLTERGRQVVVRFFEDESHDLTHRLIAAEYLAQRGNAIGVPLAEKTLRSATEGEGPVYSAADVIARSQDIQGLLAVYRDWPAAAPRSVFRAFEQAIKSKLSDIPHEGGLERKIDLVRRESNPRLVALLAESIKYRSSTPAALSARHAESDGAIREYLTQAIKYNIDCMRQYRDIAALQGLQSSLPAQDDDLRQYVDGVLREMRVK